MRIMNNKSWLAHCVIFLSSSLMFLPAYSSEIMTRRECSSLHGELYEANKKERRIRVLKKFIKNNPGEFEISSEKSLLEVPDYPELGHDWYADLYKNLGRLGDLCSTYRTELLRVRMILANEIKVSNPGAEIISLLKAGAASNVSIKNGRRYITHAKTLIGSGVPGIEELLLGFIYDIGIYVGKDSVKAKTYYKAAYGKSNEMAGFQLARQAYRDGNIDETLDIINEISFQGSIHSLRLEITLYADLRNIVPREWIPFGWALESRGNLIGQVLAPKAFNRAAAYARGVGSKRDLTRALNYYTLAARLGGGMQQAMLAAGLLEIETDPRFKMKNVNKVELESVLGHTKYLFESASNCSDKKFGTTPSIYL